jgi:2'-5' RNA ligase
MALRAFVAVEVSDDLKQELAMLQGELRRALASAQKSARVAWVTPSSFHLTLKFLGQTAESDVERLRELLADAVAPHPGTRIAFERIGTFPSPSRPAALWVGPMDSWMGSNAASRLAHLHDAIQACCEAIGAARERRAYHPHLTLARVKEGAAEIGRILTRDDLLSRAVSLPPLPIESVALMRSDTRPTGSVYTRLWTLPLSTTLER